MSNNLITLTGNSPKQYLCLFHLITAGLLDDQIGSDEQEIIEMIYLIIDVDQTKTVALHRQYVRPLFIDNLTNECQENSGINQTLVFSSEDDLDRALEKFEIFLKNLQFDCDLSKKITFVCENCLHLRQCLHPESVKKSTRILPNYYWSYFDLKFEFTNFYKTSSYSDLNSMLQQLNISSISDDDYSMRHIRNMELLVYQMLKDGHCFDKPEFIMNNLQQGICSFEDNIDDNTIIRARGLPWQCTDQDVAKFFRGLDIEKGGVALCLSNQGRRNGEAFVRFSNVEHRELALRRHKHHIGQRYIEVYKATGRDFLNIAGGSYSETQTFLQRNGQVIIRMRGLPFDATAKDVIEFFTRNDTSINIVDGEEGVLFVHYPDGRRTGDAFIMVKNEEQAIQALFKHKESMGTRYIELFRSTAAEVQQVFRRSQDPKNWHTLMKDIPFTPLSILSPDMLTTGNRRDCIRVRNLPIDCGIEQILEFLGPHSQYIIPQGVHMIYNIHGQPSGEAFIQMNSENASFNASMHKNKKYLYFNGKKYYIEVLQCSGEDMNQILLGLVPSNLIPRTNLCSPSHRVHLPPSIHPISTYSSPNPNYYPMQVIYYPSPSIYLPTGPIHHPTATSMTVLLRGDHGHYS